jgi:hypothetical protein
VEKVCTKCLELKPIESFYRDRKTNDGRKYYCKDCSNKLNLEYFHQRTKNTDWYKAKHRANQKKYSQKFPEKILAQQLAKKVPLKSDCENCGNIGALHRHHPDHSQPLKVITLCIPCHEAEHHRKEIKK